MSAPTPPRTARRAWLGVGWTRAGAFVPALVVLGVVVAASLVFGSRSVGFGDAWRALVDFDVTDANQIVVHDHRIPRTIVGLCVGAMLGLAGALMQGVTRNPLADPGIFGIEAGASLAVVVGIRAFGVHTAAGYVWFAFGGAAIASVVVYGIGSLGRGGATPVKIALAGAAVAAMLAALTSGILLVDVSTFDEFRFWAVGSIAGRDLDVVASLAPFLVAGVLLAVVSARSLNGLALGDDTARSLGHRVALERAICGVAVVVCSGTAVAMAGPIGFIGLTVPHIARVISGPDYRWILPWSMVLAPCLLLVSDVVGRVVARPEELQVGLVTAFVGAPVFIALVRRRHLPEL